MTMRISASKDDVAKRMDRLPLQLLHFVATGICAIALAFDLLEISLSSALSAWFSSAPHVASPEQLGWLMSSVFIGAIVGAPTFGCVGDRYGRRRAMSATLALLTVASFAAARSASIAELSIWRGIAGLALGAFPPLVMSYLTDILPAKRRGAMIFVALAFATLGPVCGIYLIRWLLPYHPFGLDAWRWGFIVGGVGAGVAAGLFLTIPESPRWLFSRGRTREAEATYDRFEGLRIARSTFSVPAPDSAPSVIDDIQLLRSPTIVREWSLVALLFFLSPWATVAFPILTGAILSNKGFHLNDNLFYVNLSTIGPMLGIILSAAVVDVIDRRLALTVSAVAMVAAGIWFSVSVEPSIVACTIVGFTMFSAFYISLLNVYGAEQFTTRLRARSMSAAWACNRIGAAISPMILLSLLHSAGPTAMFSAIAISLVASVALLAVAPSGKQRQSVA